MFGFPYVPALLTRRHLKSLAKHHRWCFILTGIKMMLANLTLWKLLSKHHYCNEHFRMIFFFLSSFTNSSYTIFSVLTSFKIIQQIKPSQSNWGALWVLGWIWQQCNWAQCLGESFLFFFFLAFWNSRSKSSFVFLPNWSLWKHFGDWFELQNVLGKLSSFTGYNWVSSLMKKTDVK